MKTLTAFLFMLICSSAFAVDLPSYGCENFSDRFDQNLDIIDNRAYAGLKSCQMAAGDNYTYQLSPQISPTNGTFRLDLFVSQDRILTVRGILSNGSTVNFTRTLNQSSAGSDGRTWYHQVYTYSGGLAVNSATLNSIRLSAPNTLGIDSIFANIGSPLIGQRYLSMQTGFENLVVNYDTDSVLYEVLKPLTFKMTGIIPTNNTATILELDPGLNPDVYLECMSAILTSFQAALADQLGAAYQVGCVPPTISSSGRGIFFLRNTGTTPVSPVNFVIQINTVVRILETAGSLTSNYELLINTTF